MRCTLIMITLVLISAALRAQDRKGSDRLKLVDGSKIRGDITSFSKGESLSITSGGFNKEFKGDEFQFIEEIQFDYYQKYNRQGKIWTSLELGMNFGRSNDFNGSTSSPLILINSGFQFSRYAGLGVGSGYQPYDHINIIPVYITFRGDLFDTQVTPYYFVDLGYGIGLDKDPDFFIGESENDIGGLMTSLGGGVKYKLPKSFISLAIGYQIQRTKTESDFSNFFPPIRPSAEDQITVERTIRRMSLRLGIGF